jgi:hypothetical protein
MRKGFVAGRRIIGGRVFVRVVLGVENNILGPHGEYCTVPLVPYFGVQP